MATLPYNTKIEFTPIMPSTLDPSRPSMGVTAPGATVHGKVVGAGVLGSTEFQNDAAGKWPLRVGDAIWCEPSGIRVIVEQPQGGQRTTRYFVDREFIVAVEPL